MGIFTSKRKEEACIEEGEEVTFDHFQVLRAIGRGSFGKVCIVQKKDTKKMFAMKYMNKSQCSAKDALQNVFREIEILATLRHPFLVNLWYSFQDAEDMFMVVELLLGGDLRYHLQQGVTFSDLSVRLYLLEIAAALTYLHTHGIIHRDIKPDNLLLDEEGHVHLSDLNVAAVVKTGQTVTSMSGTRPYMAPEIFECAACDDVYTTTTTTTTTTRSGYDRAVDWWSLGVSAYEILTSRRPFDIHSNTSLQDIRRIFRHRPPNYSNSDPRLVQLINGLLTVEPLRRIQSLSEVQLNPFMAALKVEDVLKKRIKPPFTPPKDQLNCDPTFELEEMIIESRPLHKKKKRLSKQKSLTHTSHSGGKEAEEEEERYGAMLVFNREMEERKKERERKQREREEREKKWQEELEESMRLSDPTGQGSTYMGSQFNTPTKKNKKNKENRTEEEEEEEEEEEGNGKSKIKAKKSISPTSVRKRIARSPKERTKDLQEREKRMEEEEEERTKDTNKKSKNNTNGNNSNSSNSSSSNSCGKESKKKEKRRDGEEKR